MILIKSISSMNKCFMDECICSKAEITRGEALRGEEFAYEVAYTSDDPGHFPKAVLHLEVESPIVEYINVRMIEQVPVRVPCYSWVDDNYLRKTPGLYPDILTPLDPDGQIFATYGQLKSLLVTVMVPEELKGGDYPITVKFTAGGSVAAETTITLHVIDAVLPAQEFNVTEWFHCDCIANYYNLETFSDKHWEYIENFVRTAVANGINTIIMPVFTPPLDTAVGHERRTTQLTEVRETENGWEFGFEKIDRWVEMCKRCGVKNYEISHLYTQWGAAHAPKVMGTDKNGEYRRLFGWETESTSDEYRTFLRSFITALLARMTKLGIKKENIFFHISDEPSLEQLDSYKAAKAQIADLVEGHRVMDALSNFEFYKTGALAHPVPANNHIEPFLEANIPDLWTYYCCGQSVDVSNRFIAMSMARTRVIGVQFWKYNITGFLQWGYNFYSSQGSIRPIDPFQITDGEYFVPAGDCFSVAPGPYGIPYETLHLKGFTYALSDLRAMKLAESLSSREEILSIIEGEGEVTFSKYPHSAEWLEGVRAKINAIIER